MFKAQNANVPLDFDFRMGLGWMLSGVDVPRAGIVASHGGTTLNYHTMLAVLPEHKLGVVVLSNSANAQAVVAKVTEETLKLALEAKRGITQPQRPVRRAEAGAAQRGRSAGIQRLFRNADRPGQGGEP